MGVKERNRFEGYNQPFIRASFSSDGKKFAATNMDNVIKIWNSNGKEIATINQKESDNIASSYTKTGDCPVNSVSFSPKNNIIAASDGDNIKLWDFNGKELNKLQGKGKDVTVTSISNDGKLIAAVNIDGKVRDFQGIKYTFIKMIIILLERRKGSVALPFLLPGFYSKFFFN